MHWCTQPLGAMTSCRRRVVHMRVHVYLDALMMFHCVPAQGKTIKRVDSHKWLGCIVEFSCRDHSLSHHVHAATRAFHANKWSSKISMFLYHLRRLQYFNRVMTPVACFASGRHAIYQQDLHKLDILHRKLLRSVCGPPGNIDWSCPWHEILHEWHERVRRVTSDNGLQRSWSEMCLSQYWKFGSYVAGLPSERWAKSVLFWTPQGRRSQGHQREAWDTKFMQFCVANNLGRWETAAQDTAAWLAMTDDCLTFCGMGNI